MLSAVLAILLIAVSFAAIYFASKARNQPSNSISVATSEAREYDIKADLPDAPNTFSGITVVNGSGVAVIKAEEVFQLPFSAQKIEKAERSISSFSQAATDLLGGVAKLPGRTIRLSFSPEVAQGLRDGTYTLMTSKTGEVFADAMGVSASGRNVVVEKGRLVSSGQAAQLAGGAFMLLSIAVSQKHLADIERSLGGIKKGISDLREHIENQDRSNIAGAINYLEEMLGYVQKTANPGSISSEKSHALESLIRNSFVWLELVQSDMESLIRSVLSIESKDTIGTKYTHKEIKDHIAKAAAIISRYELYLKLSAAEHFIVTYLDPLGLKYTRPRDGADDWLRAIDRFKDAITARTQALTQSAFVDPELLEYRNREVSTLAEECRFRAYQNINTYTKGMSKLNEYVKGMLAESGEVQIALRYNNDYEVEEAAFLT